MCRPSDFPPYSARDEALLRLGQDVGDGPRPEGGQPIANPEPTPTPRCDRCGAALAAVWSPDVTFRCEPCARPATPDPIAYTTLTYDDWVMAEPDEGGSR